MLDLDQLWINLKLLKHLEVCYWLFLCNNTLSKHYFFLRWIICSKRLLTRILIWIHDADSEPHILCIYIRHYLYGFYFFFSDCAHQIVQNTCQLLITLERTKTDKYLMLINFGECDCEYIKIRNAKSLSYMYSVGQLVYNKFKVYHHKECVLWKCTFWIF